MYSRLVCPGSKPLSSAVATTTVEPRSIAGSRAAGWQAAITDARLSNTPSLDVTERTRRGREGDSRRMLLSQPHAQST
jgi:hypothetical protein